ncbi:uncharacterized protein LOC118205892 [Stegodyphus dumicola]|uniref:uncharacterized protein LOC118205892 n=1 Tax=Stegodyphus dumicola TaxID=202533 RepID=UPI0015B06C7E|nr:uncharacterized protein LOC118205892 [Stegodyphus dumicola]XP_035234056.1 uncharacterized protein LOC118205892 [Stegodyphus dumicola]
MKLIKYSWKIPWFCPCIIKWVPDLRLLQHQLVALCIWLVPMNDRGIDEAIVLTQKSRRRNHKYQAEEINFRASVDIERLPLNVQGIPMVRILDTVRELFEQLIRRTTANLGPSDLIRFCIQAEGLDKPISTSLMAVSTLTVEKILTAVMKVLQSKDKIELDTGFSVDVITIKRPVGAGGNRKVINISMDRLRKQSILPIPYDDEGLCCAKAIVYALAHLNDYKAAIKAMKDRRRPALVKHAKELHMAANVPLGPCTFAEIAIFEDHLDVQIAVISSENLNRVVYKGRERSQRINLWLHDGHYDVIKSLCQRVFASNHYCTACEKHTITRNAIDVAMHALYA